MVGNEALQGQGKDRERIANLTAIFCRRIGKGCAKPGVNVKRPPGIVGDLRWPNNNVAEMELGRRRKRKSLMWS